MLSKMPPVILVIGSDGQVGWELMRSLSTLGTVVGTSLYANAASLRLDLAQPQTIATMIDHVRPSLIVNAAAYTAVDKAEQESDLATAINATALAELGHLAVKMNIPIIHYSTDFVFAGTSHAPYQETDLTGPLGVYGQSKLAGENALINSGASWIILRTSWVYGVRGQNFLLTMRRLFNERQQVQVVNDQVGCPTWSRLLAEATAQIWCQIQYRKLSFSDIQGIYHISGAGSTSWYGFAQTIHQHGNYRCRLAPIASVDYPATAARPAYSVLDNTKIQKTFGIFMPHWQQSLNQCLADLPAHN
ncbi:dTDP-4-dehydrorhamnose reductase [Achromatium sp. WMS2]|nr:dTDP-4-dehydrorhamnose reductase [Achromatium sp. WMS2]